MICIHWFALLSLSMVVMTGAYSGVCFIHLWFRWSINYLSGFVLNAVGAITWIFLGYQTQTGQLPW